MTVTLEVTSKLPQQKGHWLLTIPGGITVSDLLRQLAISGDWEEVLVVYNGKAACRDDELHESGKILLLPVLCGG